jgi:hypothetical protein
MGADEGCHTAQTKDINRYGYCLSWNVNVIYAGPVDSVIRKYAQSHEQRLHRHINVEALQLLNNGGLVRRLKRKKPFELV